MKKELPKAIVNPFSDQFMTTWDTWKAYKEEQFKFKYKGVYSEQAGLMELVNLSGGEEEVAIKIILQSMANGWQGLWPIKKPTSPNGKGKQSDSGTTESLRERVIRETNKKFGSGKQEGDESHLKAV